MHYLIAAVGSFIVQNMSNKEFSRRFECRMPGLVLFNAIALTICALALALAGGVGTVSAGGMLLALALAITFVVTIILIVVSMAMGPMSATVLIINMSMMIPVTASLVIWGESLTLIKVVGIACMLLVLVLSAMGGGGDKKQHGSAKWLIITIITMVCNGMLSIEQKSLSLYFPQDNVLTFNCIAFAMAAGICWLATLFFVLRKTDFSAWTGKKVPLALCAAGVGLGTAGGNTFQMLSLTLIPAVVDFPLSQGSVVLALWLLSLFIYKDKLTVQGVLSLIFGIGGIVLLSI